MSTDRPLGAKHVLTQHPSAVALMAALFTIGLAFGMFVMTMSAPTRPSPTPAMCDQYVERLNAAQANDNDARATRITVQATEAGCFHTN